MKRGERVHIEEAFLGTTLAYSGTIRGLDHDGATLYICVDQQYHRLIYDMFGQLNNGPHYWPVRKEWIVYYAKS